MPATLGFTIYDGIPLYIEEIKLWETRPVMSDDNCDRLYLHSRFGVIAVWNPAATRSALGNSAARSIVDLRTQLTRPRRKLTVTIGGVKVLDSPAPKGGGPQYYATDARNGPIVTDFKVIKVIGEKSALVYWEVETWLAVECPDNPLSVISHRWESQSQLDEHWLETRTIRGKAVFRTDLLYDAKRVADDFRQRIAVHPMPPYFKRQVTEVKASSDNTEISYTLNDAETPGVNIVGGANGLITKVDGTWNIGYSYTSPFAPASRYLWVGIDVYGRRRARRQDLINTAIKAVMSFGFADPKKDPSLWNKLDLSVDLWNKHCRLVCTVTLDGWLANIVNSITPANAGGGGLLNGLWTIVKFGFALNTDPLGPLNATRKTLFPGSDEEKKIQQGAPEALKRAVGAIQNAADLFINDKFPDGIDGVTTTDNVVNPQPPESGGTRGSSLETLVTQVLLEQCVTPAVPRSGADRPPATFT